MEHRRRYSISSPSTPSGSTTPTFSSATSDDEDEVQARIIAKYRNGIVPLPTHSPHGFEDPGVYPSPPSHASTAPGSGTVAAPLPGSCKSGKAMSGVDSDSILMASCRTTTTLATATATTLRPLIDQSRSHLLGALGAADLTLVASFLPPVAVRTRFQRVCRAFADACHDEGLWQGHAASLWVFPATCRRAYDLQPLRVHGDWAPVMAQADATASADIFGCALGSECTTASAAASTTAVDPVCDVGPSPATNSSREDVTPSSVSASSGSVFGTGSANVGRVARTGRAALAATYLDATVCCACRLPRLVDTRRFNLRVLHSPDVSVSPVAAAETSVQPLDRYRAVWLRRYTQTLHQLAAFITEKWRPVSSDQLPSPIAVTTAAASNATTAMSSLTPVPSASSVATSPAKTGDNANAAASSNGAIEGATAASAATLRQQLHEAANALLAEETAAERIQQAASDQPLSNVASAPPTTASPVVGSAQADPQTAAVVEWKPSQSCVSCALLAGPDLGLQPGGGQGPLRALPSLVTALHDGEYLYALPWPGPRLISREVARQAVMLLRSAVVTRVQTNAWPLEEKRAVTARLVSATLETVELRWFYSLRRDSFPRLFTKLVFCRSAFPRDVIDEDPDDEEVAMELFICGYGRVEVDIRPQVNLKHLHVLAQALRLDSDFPVELLWFVVMQVSGAAADLNTSLIEGATAHHNLEDFLMQAFAPPHNARA